MSGFGTTNEFSVVHSLTCHSGRVRQSQSHPKGMLNPQTKSSTFVDISGGGIVIFVVQYRSVPTLPIV